MILKMLKAELAVAWIIFGIVMLLGETGIITNGTILPNTQEEFTMNCCSIMSTLFIIPLSMKLFTLNTTKGLRRMNKDEALDFYHMWSGVRLALITAVMAFNATAYYITLNNTGVLCAVICLCITFLCWPSRSKLDIYLETVNNEL